MGASVACECSGARFWASAGRSSDSRQRAEANGLEDAGTIDDLVDSVDTIVSVCPPAAATEVAEAVASAGFTGTYIDANAISPERAHAIAPLFERFVDGGIVGPPPVQPGTTRMYLSGPDAEVVAERWEGSMLDARPLGNDVGAASALKMAYAAWTKGSAALLLLTNALADAYGVGDPLHTEWDLSQPVLVDRSRAAAASALHKAWRFEGEMLEIANTFEAAGMPNGFHEAAAEVYRRIAEVDMPRSADVADVIAALRA